MSGESRWLDELSGHEYCTELSQRAAPGLTRPGRGEWANPQQANSGFHWRIWAAAAPAVTLAFRMIGKVSRHDVVGYLVAQFAGSLIE